MRGNGSSEGSEKKRERRGAEAKIAETLRRVGGRAQAHVGEAREREAHEEGVPVGSCEAAAFLTSSTDVDAKKRQRPSREGPKCCISLRILEGDGESVKKQ